MNPPSPTVRPAVPADAAEIVAALRRAQGVSHFDRWMYDPDQVAQALGHGTLRSWVAVDAGNTVRAHGALITGGGWPPQRIAVAHPLLEYGLAFTDPDFRGQGLALQVGGQALAWAQQHHIGEVYSWTTTLRPFAQHALREVGAVEICLLLAMMPPGVNRGYQHDIDEAAAAMLFVLRVGPPTRSITWHVPARYRQLIGDLTTGLGITARSLSEDSCEPQVRQPDGESEAPVEPTWHYVAPLRFGVIKVAAAHPSTVRSVVRRTFALAQAGADVTYIDLPPELPTVMHLVPELARHGYTMAGVHPDYQTGQLRLRMQAVTCPLQAKESITTASDRGRDLLEIAWAGLPGRP